MNTIGTHFKYIEWRDTEGLHQDTLNSLSDLKFLKDELQFLKGLVGEHTIEILMEASSVLSKAIFSELTGLSKRLEKLLAELTAHSNNLKVLLDDDDVPGELRAYKDEHYQLLMEEMKFHADVKKTKRSIFSLLSGIIKEGKQKKLM